MIVIAGASLWLAIRSMTQPVSTEVPVQEESEEVKKAKKENPYEYYKTIWCQENPKMCKG